MKKILFFAMTVIVTVALAQEKRIYLDLSKAEIFSLKDVSAKKMLPSAVVWRFAQLQKEATRYAAAVKVNPSILSFTGSMAFYTVGIDSVAAYFDYAGSVSAFDQCGFQIGKASASMFDTTMVQYVTSMPAGQSVFVRKNLESGVQYRFKFFAFDATAGTVIFYPSGNASYYATTIFVAQSSLGQTSYLNCAGPVKSVDIGPVSSNDPNTFLKVLVDTGVNPNFNSAYSLTWTMPQFNIGAIGTVMSYSINVTSLIKWNLNDPNAKYSSKVIMRNSANWKDSTIASCLLPTGVEERAEGKSFTIFPNPAATDVTVISTVEGNLKLYDLVGREVKSEKIISGNTVLAHKDFLPGLYFYRLITEKGEATGKLIFMK